MCERLDPTKSYQFGHFTIGLDPAGEVGLGDLAILADHDLEQPGPGDFYLIPSAEKTEKPRHMIIRCVPRK